MHEWLLVVAEATGSLVPIIESLCVTHICLLGLTGLPEDNHEPHLANQKMISPGSD